MAAPTRGMEIVYGTLTVGGASGRQLTGEYDIEESSNRAVVEFEFFTRKETEADFDTEITTIQDALRTPRQKLTVTLGATDIKTYDPTAGASGNSGFNQQVTWFKEDSPATSGRSWKYRVRIEMDMPADQHGTSGRRDSSVELNFTPSGVREMILSGTYTAITSNEARAQFLANIDTYANGLLDGFGGNGIYNLVEKSETADDQNKLLDFRRVYREIIFNEQQGTLNNSAIIDQTLQVTVDNEAIDDSPLSYASLPTSPGGSGVPGGVVARFAKLRVVYSASIDTGTSDLRELYESTIREHLFQTALAQFDVGRIAIFNDDPKYDLAANRIDSTMEVWSSDGSSVVAFKATQSIKEETGIRLIPVWDPDPFKRHVINGPPELVTTITEISTVLIGAVGGGGINIGGATAFPPGSGGGGGTIGPGAGGGGGSNFGPFGFFQSSPISFVGGGGGRGPSTGQGAFGSVDGAIETTDYRKTPRRIGIGDTTIDVIDFETTRVWRKFNPLDFPHTPNVPTPPSGVIQ